MSKKTLKKQKMLLQICKKDGDYSSSFSQISMSFGVHSNVLQIFSKTLNLIPVVLPLQILFMFAVVTPDFWESQY